MSDVLHVVQDFRQRILQAEKLRRQGDEEAAFALMPSREDLVEAIKAYRQSIGARSASRSASSKTKQSAAAIASLDPSKLLD